MKNWILINDKKFEIFSSNLKGEYVNNSKMDYIRAFTRYFEQHAGNVAMSYLDCLDQKNVVKNKIRVLIRFEDLNLPIWNKGTEINFFIKINRTHL